MIGVLSKDSETRAVQEFFQLFKTPWEFFVPRKHYDLVIITRGEIPEDLNANVLVVYQSHAIEFDDELGLTTTSRRRCDWVEWQDIEFPIYGDLSDLSVDGYANAKAAANTRDGGGGGWECGTADSAHWD